MGWDRWNTMTTYDRYMLFVVLVSRVFIVIQIITIIINGSSENVSFTAYYLLLLGSVSWLFFGIFQKSLIVTVSAFLGVLGAITSLNVIVMYKPNKTDIL